MGGRGVSLGPQAVHPRVVWENKLITEGLPLASHARVKGVRPSHPQSHSKSKDRTVTEPGSFQGQSRSLSLQLSCHLCARLLPASPPTPFFHRIRPLVCPASPSQSRPRWMIQEPGSGWKEAGVLHPG